ncbi:PQQ-dependent sugar dehydrogenase [Acinetobacter qingfengensis]|uniref:Glucose dehydrogenase n=1 Tax=Acinetobacter qingfengensis TaxID=1262585 RepID=A0A1E7R510_9GAMM|nr:PQQ-dependent sugar dehydrogenase [Acinetobacter qingfengensis]KAA8732380.1 PQQ-dependent sugar dehydrogenase [Acinetobacter qingfengensis]OEY94375.1 glucose dehydrogenase [Acinetobacter qingfengensis]
MLKNLCLFLALSGILVGLTACGTSTPEAASHDMATSTEAHVPKFQQNFQIDKIASFDEPWALTQLPDGRLLITERKGVLKIFDPLSQQSIDVFAVPSVAYGGQGGLGDVILHPDFSHNGWIYLSYATRGNGGYGAEVIRARLDLSLPAKPKLLDQKVVWQQVPKTSGQGHYAHRMRFDQQGKLWISSGERQKFDPAQDMQSNLGKILRLNDDGTAADGNPFASQGGIAAQIWSLGHRNPLGMDFDQQGQLWVVEMGPQGGDELNLIEKGQNYGYPLVSNGDHYNGQLIPDHATRPEFEAPKISWTPVISPSSLMIYRGDQLEYWTGKAIIGGLSSQAIIVVDIQQQPAREIQRIDMKARIRGLLEAPDGAIWVLEDGEKANLLRLHAK